VAQDYEIFRSMILSNTAVIFAERYIQAPMQTVFNAPMVSKESKGLFPESLKKRATLLCRFG
jgi:hypothetical protein